LTPHQLKGGGIADSSGEAGAPEIEVTPAMIEAGLEEYGSVWTDLRDARPGAAEVALVRIYAAMAGRRE
jgi:hypothetical protein